MNLSYTNDALEDLLAIMRFIARDNPQRALSFVTELEGACEALTNFPLARPLVTEIAHDVRRAVYGNYNIYYFIDGDELIVFGVIEGHRRQAQALTGRRSQ